MSANFTRRDFAALTLNGLSAATLARNALAAPQCVAPPQQPYLPNLLWISCASRQNFKLFRQYSTYLGLAGVVSMTSVRGATGPIIPGSLLLYPWLKPAGQKLNKSTFKAYLPTGVWTSESAKPIPGAALPQDEYLCRVVLGASAQAFIGFTVDTPPAYDLAMPAWRTTIPKLADGQGVEVDWTSSNLNRAWFGGHNAIPQGATCSGGAWRALIAETLNQVSASAC